MHDQWLYLAALSMGLFMVLEIVSIFVDRPLREAAQPSLDRIWRFAILFLLLSLATR